MLIRAETPGQSLRIHGKKGCRGGGCGAESEKQEETKKLEKREEQFCEGKVRPPAVHSRLTLL